MISFQTKAQFNKDAAVILLTKSQIEKKKFNFSNAKIQNAVLDLAKNKTFCGDKDSIFPLTNEKKLVLLVGVDESKDANLTSLRITIKKALSSSYLKNAKTIELIPQVNDEPSIQALIEGIMIGAYKWKKYIKADEKEIKLKQIIIATPNKPAYQKTIEICDGVNFTRDLVNDNADVITSEYFEKTIKSLIKGKKNIALKILNTKELSAQGCGLHLAVNKGSDKEPKLIIVKYAGGKKSEPYTALVGKGLTFDSGGLNLKPTGHMETMRCDMSGAAAVVGTLKNVLKLNIKKNLVFVCGMAENAIGSCSYKPGDVFVGYAGKSVEIGNTDAEGRLVLADTIAYTVKNYKPATLIDIATLTGAVAVGLGFDFSGLLSNDQKLADALLKSSQETDDRIWQLPLYVEIRDAIKSNYADLRNSSNIKGGGAITGAEFLRNFIGDTKSWAHLDIAGSAFVEGTSRMYYGYGGTGAGVRLLTHYLINN
ncbi:MAG: leucyl aminopeptidase [Candidatus Omnitrophica bacterium]|nr:leucyl aminopeptidase [Candidatus Omnitrophota bacterium]